MPRQNDKDNGRGPAGARPRGKSSPRGKGGPGSKGRPGASAGGYAKPPGRGGRSRPRDGDDERRKAPPATGAKPFRAAGKGGAATRPLRGGSGFRRDDERGGERAPRKAFRDGERDRSGADQTRPVRERRPFRRDEERDAERGPRKTFRHHERRREDEGEAKPYRKAGPPRRFERPRAADDAAPRVERKHFPRPRDGRNDRDAERAPRRFERPQGDRVSRASRPERSDWHDHPRSEGREAARPRRPAAAGDSTFRKRTTFDKAAIARPGREKAAIARPARKPRAVQAPPPRPDKSGERIAKIVARAGLASRREAEAWITQGRVAVNGRVITSPALDVTARDVVTVDGQRLPEPERTRLFLYHKPRGLMTTHADPEGRPMVFDNLPPGLPRLISVGRLDFNTEGLLLLTNDGGLARALELPQTGWLRRYRVRAHGEVTQPQLDALRAGITIEGVNYGAIEATLERTQGANVWLTFAIREGKNREVRNVLTALGLDVNRLIRVSYGPFQLGEIEEGQVDEVKTRVLREQIGETLLRRAGAYFPHSTMSAGSETKAAKPRIKRAVVADRKGRKVVVERAVGDDGEPRRDGSAPYRRPQRRYHGKRDLTPRD